MDPPIHPHTTDAAANEPPKLFRDLRAHNERRASRTRLLDAQRRQRVERVMQVASQRRFRRGG